MLADLAPDLVILNGGMNDRNTRTKAEFKADLETLLLQYRAANADCAIILMLPTIPANGPGALPDYRDAMLELCETYDCAFVDTAWILGENADAEARGLILSDKVHPTETGYRYIASWLFEYIGGATLAPLYFTPWDGFAPDADVDARSVNGLEAGALWDATEVTNPDGELVLSATGTNLNVYAQPTGSGSFRVQNKNTPNRIIRMTPGSSGTSMSIQAVENPATVRTLILQPSGGNLSYKNEADVMTAAPQIQLASPTSGATVVCTADAVDRTLYLTPAGTLATLTITLPANSTARSAQVQRIVTTQELTALTVDGAATIIGNVTTLAANSSVSFQRVASNVWARL